MARLIASLPNGSRTALRLEAGKRRLVGSDPRCSVRLPVPSVEPFHCEIFHASGLWQIRDLQSAGGTRVNGAAIQSEALAGGDTIEIGEAMLVFESEDRAPAGLRRLGATLSGAARPRATRRGAPGGGALRGGASRSRAAALRGPRSLAPFIALVVVVAAGLVVAIALSSAGTVRSVPESVKEDVGAASGVGLSLGPGGGVADVAGPPEGPSGGLALEGSVSEPRRAEPSASAPALAPALATEWDPARRDPSVEGSPGGDDLAEEPGAGAPIASAPAAGAPAAGAPAARDAGIRDPGVGDRGLAELREAVLVDLVALDVDAAEARIGKAREKGLDAEGLTPLETECTELRAVRDVILGALESSVLEKATLDVPRGTSLVSAAPDPVLRIGLGGGGQTGSNQVRVIEVERERRTVTLSTARGARIGTFRVTSLPDDLLLGLLEGTEGTREDGGPGARIRLARLLFHAEGPARARAFLEPDRDAAGTSHLTAVPGPRGETDADSAPDIHARLWVGRKARSTARERARLEEGGGVGASASGGTQGSGGAPGSAWAVLASEALCALASRDALKASEDALEQLRDDFLAARRASLPLAALFHAAEVSPLEDGRVRIAYDFAGERNPADQTTDQTADFRPIGLSTEKPRILKKILILQGEYRLLSGEPFVGRLSVRGKATPLVPEAPNVNVALWTHATDAVTCHDGAVTTWFTLLRQQVGAPSDYFVFGMGYRAVAWMLLDKPAEQVLLASTRESVDLPALVLLAGSRGSPLHKDLGECLLAEKVSPGGLRKVDFLLDWDGAAGDGVAGDGAAVTWTVNGHPVVLEGELTRSRLDATARRRGSVTILTNGRPVGLAVVEVVGELDPAWVGAERTARALRDLEREAPAPAGQVPAGASTPPGNRADGQPVADASLPVPGRRLEAGERGLHARGPTNENGPRKS